MLKLQLYMLFLQFFATAKLAFGKNKIIQNSKSSVGVPALVMLSLSKHLAVRRIFTSPDKFFISSRLYKSFKFETLNAMLPLPFGLSPTSRTYCLLFLATHRSKRGSRRSHRKVSSPCYATTLCAPGSSQQYGAIACTSHTRVPARQKQANLCLSYKMKEQFFGAWDKGTPRPKCKRL